MGPLVVGCVYTEDDAPFREMGVKDSKKLTPKRREALYSRITECASDWCVVIISADEVDERRKRKSLNEVEADMFLEASSKIPVSTVYADCPDVNEAGFSNSMAARMGMTEVIARHKADDTYPVVSAASIIAKVTRDRMVADICEELGFDIGSGYPSDQKTMDFIQKWIKDYGHPPKHTRCSWEPVRHMMSTASMRKITDW